MLQLLHGTDFPFMRYRRMAYVLSAIVLAITFAWLVRQGGPRYSVDFTGGRLLALMRPPSTPLMPIESATAKPLIGPVPYS